VRGIAGCLLVAALAAVAPPALAQEGSTTTVIVVRHAERASRDPNSDLSPAGLARAAALVPLVTGRGVAAIYTTEFCRTAQTAEPSAVALGVPLFVAGIGSRAGGLDGCNPAIRSERVAVESAAAPATLARRILDAHPGGTVVVVGHSNTVPALVEALGGPTQCGRVLPRADGECNLAEDVFHHVFVVRVTEGAGATVEHLSVGRVPG
jgi:phosphohistidine phosphatase SixA